MADFSVGNITKEVADVIGTSSSGDDGAYPPYYDMGNFSLGYKETLEILKQQHEVNPFDKWVEVMLIAVFTTLIVFGALGNGLVCLVVMLNSHMRTPRNIFIINLAISDFTLCVFTQPLNLYRLLNVQWHLGGFMCKFSAMLQGTNVFVSTISITAIALDRFQVIVYPTKDSMKKIGGAAALITIWVISFLMSSPLLIFSVYTMDRVLLEVDFYVFRCIEDLNLRAEKGAYSVASMVVQYILPIITVSIAHARICNKLRYRMVNRNPPHRSSGEHHSPPRRRNNTNARVQQRKRRTNILLSMIAVVFVFSWMPLNVGNILVEFQFQIFRNKDIDINLVFVICHMLVLSSACTNPFLYGWLNENFRKEFLKVLRCIPVRRFVSNLNCTGKQNRDVPTIVLSRDQNGCGCNASGKQAACPPSNAQILMTTDIEPSHSAVSL